MTYFGYLHATVVKDNTALLTINVHNAGRQFTINGWANIESGQVQFIQRLTRIDPILVAFEVAKTGEPAAYKVTSLTHLDSTTNRVVFGTGVVAVAVGSGERKAATEIQAVVEHTGLIAH